MHIVQYFATDLLMHNGECHGVMAMCMEGQWRTRHSLRDLALLLIISLSLFTGSTYRTCSKSTVALPPVAFPLRPSGRRPRGRRGLAVRSGECGCTSN